MMNTRTNFSQHVGFGMPVSARLRVSSLRALATTGAVSSDAGQKCVLMAANPIQGATAGYSWVATAFVATGAFPGASAWSPPV